MRHDAAGMCPVAPLKVTRRDSMVLLLVRGQISSLDWYKIIWPYKLHQFARFGRQLAAISFM
jgi:hypothetical protein